MVIQVQGAKGQTLRWGDCAMNPSIKGKINYNGVLSIVFQSQKSEKKVDCKGLKKLKMDFVASKNSVIIIHF